MLLEARNASKTFRARRGAASVAAVSGVTLQARPGEFVAIVGESGSGKSTLARMLLGLIPATSGEIEFDGLSLGRMNRTQVRAYRTGVQAVLQDPSGSLNPRKTVERSLGEIVRLHHVASGRAAVRARVVESLNEVGLSPAEAFLDRYPQELSGGQRQRVLIARALVLSPQIIIADEAVSALDASVKAGILKLMNGLTERLGVGYVFITHDLPVVRKVAQRVYVMKDGHIVEGGSTTQIFTAAKHPYTRSLLASALTLDASSSESPRSDN
ncbi:hypothetical protein GCM10009808_12220 [Microbacterium sediminicola]|uniref:ABC transporter domain-containing protein n=1 Tax=Microbacterium sediminicola TaxID=415210 RepID=A0ABN2I096_9MICO